MQLILYRYRSYDEIRRKWTHTRYGLIEREGFMALKKLLSETTINLLAHYLARGVTSVVTVGLPIWIAIKESLSLPVVLAIGVVLFAACFLVYRNLFPTSPTAKAAYCSVRLISE